MMGFNFNPEQMAKNMITQQFGGEEQAISQLRKMAGNHPVMKNALDLFEKGDMQALNNLGTNVFKENNLNPQSMMQNLFQRFMGQGGGK